MQKVKINGWDWFYNPEKRTLHERADSVGLSLKFLTQNEKNQLQSFLRSYGYTI